MRLNADTILNAQSYINPIGDRELNLRGLQIPVIENLGVTEDHYTSLDLSDNEIRVMGGFPRLETLRTLLLSKNRITQINDVKNIAKLETLVLTQNGIATLGALESLKSLVNLTAITLDGNPVQHVPRYRSYMISILPSLRMLDFQRVTQKERDEAEAMEFDVVPVTETDNLSAVDKAELRERLKNATTIQEIEEIEAMLKV
ncbi:U2 small nuclear ribonucleo protein A [Yarrowia lipolytica]|nr:U2 small nuclear ribonucleo protein A [Yarrowia lipolytica]KAE8175363.1 U2 small nuclear ribonucleo protein A [Yarrowia lipolytica]RDW28117.1 U2 small nuclear ribonucleo protein A [Yarrowia lipolytica]RDW34295.1 U2 small nuclear ribonucleo protein A [Yarrowia lipolytica]RDW42499.1 U2 small nuclear ribonucleo protein A [Yarrowia lipolytica]